MKTIKIRLIVTMITLASTITITSIPVNAQRRSNSTRNERIVTPKSTDITNRSNQKSTSTSRNSSKKQVNKATPNKNRIDIAKIPRTVERSDRYKSGEKNSNAIQRTENNTRRESVNRANSNQAINNVNRNTERPRNDNSAINNSNNRLRSNRNSNTIDRNRPSSSYNGSSRYWHEKYNADNLNKRNNRSSNHWDRNWERYRWNDRSWYNYYNRYQPHSYLYHKHYYHHPRLGHVIRRFLTRPMVFVFNHIPYYCYDGFFFTYKRGAGYVLTDLPYGVVFPELPYGYETVYINGYLYFRIGNLFFEYNGYGYQLVYYPERFYAFRY